MFCAILSCRVVPCYQLLYFVVIYTFLICSVWPICCLLLYCVPLSFLLFCSIRSVTMPSLRFHSISPDVLSSAPFCCYHIHHPLFLICLLSFCSNLLNSFLLTYSTLLPFILSDLLCSTLFTVSLILNFVCYHPFSSIPLCFLLLFHALTCYLLLCSIIIYLFSSEFLYIIVLCPVLFCVSILSSFICLSNLAQFCSTIFLYSIPTSLVLFFSLPITLSYSLLAYRLVNYSALFSSTVLCSAILLGGVRLQSKKIKFMIFHLGWVEFNLIQSDWI